MIKKHILTNVKDNAVTLNVGKCFLFDEIDLIMDLLRSEYNISMNETIKIYEYSEIITSFIFNFIDTSSVKNITIVIIDVKKNII